MGKKYYKLVRDNIPAIIKNSGKEFKCKALNDKEFLFFLKEKLIEETNEFDESLDIKELADIQEVINALVFAKGYTLEEFEEIRKEKAQKNGAFEKKIFLEWVEDNE